MRDGAYWKTHLRSESQMGERTGVSVQSADAHAARVRFGVGATAVPGGLAAAQHETSEDSISRGRATAEQNEEPPLQLGKSKGARRGGLPFLGGVSLSRVPTLLVPVPGPVCAVPVSGPVPVELGSWLRLVCSYALPSRL